jgi:flagellar biosynthesis protein FlhF
MRIKTFYARTMAEALREIKAKLGPDALLLSTKETPCRSGVGGSSSGFEVVAACDSRDDVSLSSVCGESERSTAAGFALRHDDSAGFIEAGDVDLDLYSPASLLKHQPKPTCEKTTAQKTRPRKRGTKAPQEAELPFGSAVGLSLYRDLIERGVQEWLATKLVSDAAANLNPRQRRSKAAILRSLTNVANSLISTPQTEDGMPAKKVVIFIGPTGVGKTTSVAKLAARLALQKRKKVVLMTLDGYRIGAIEQLRTYARLMGIPFRFIGQVADLPKAIHEQGQKDYILIDTAGRGPKDLEEMHDLAAFLQRCTNIERHLVLSATTKPVDLKETVDRFEVCKPDHLIFTKVDETSTLGPILNELVRTHKSLSYYTDGQRVPEDLHPVSGGRIIDMVLNQN